MRFETLGIIDSVQKGVNHTHAQNADFLLNFDMLYDGSTHNPCSRTKFFPLEKDDSYVLTLYNSEWYLAHSQSSNYKLQAENSVQL